MGGRRLQRCHAPPQRFDGVARRHQPSECGLRPNVAHDHGRAELAPIGHPDADGVGAAEDNPFDVCADDNGAAAPLDGRKQTPRNLAGAADRIRGALEVMRGDDCVDGKAALAWG
jgi:hypothetical protein